MEAKYRLVTTWPEDSVQVRDRASNEILVEMKPHELVAMKNTFDQAREALKECSVELKEYLDSCGDCDHSVGICVCGLKRLIEDVDGIIAAMEATHE